MELTLQQQAHLDQCVVSGAEFCDRNRPDWFTRVNRATLDLHDGVYCACAQAFDFGLGATGWVRGTHLAIQQGLRIEELGFIVALCGVPTHIQYEYMRERWIEQIEKRLANAGFGWVEVNRVNA